MAQAIPSPDSAIVDFDFLLQTLYTKLLPESVRWNLGENLYNAYVGGQKNGWNLWTMLKQRK